MRPSNSCLAPASPVVRMYKHCFVRPKRYLRLDLRLRGKSSAEDAIEFEIAII